LEISLANSPIRLLIVDDNPTFLETISAYMQEHHAEDVEIVGVAESGKEAITRTNDLLPRAVLLDLKMQDKHGLNVIPLLRQSIPNLCIIVTTLLAMEIYEQAGDIYKQAALIAGADDFLPKALLTTKLMPTLKNLIQSQGAD